LIIFVLKASLKKTSRLLLRILKITGITLVSVIILFFLAPYLFPETVGKQIKQWTNQSIKGDLNYSKVRLSFFSHFPSLTLTLYDVDLKGSAPYQHDTLNQGRLNLKIRIYQKLMLSLPLKIISSPLKK
jgi:AsmA protein